MGAGLTRVLEAVVRTADVEASVAFARNAFGLDVLDTSPDGVLLGVTGSPGGRLRFVAAPQAVVTAPPAVWDTGPRLLGMYSRDVDVTVRQVTDAGGHARDPVSYAYGPAEMREMVARGPDGVWWTVPQVPVPPMSPQPSPALEGDPDRTHAELHTVVLVVADVAAALRFFVDAGGMTAVFDGEMTGETFERLVGMPPGAALRLAFLVGPERAPARVELMSFTGVEPADRTSDVLGLRRLVMGARHVSATRQALVEAGGEALAGDAVRGPAGIEIQLVEDDAS